MCPEILTTFAKCPTAACERTGCEDVVMKNKNRAIKLLNNDFHCHTCGNSLRLCSFSCHEYKIGGFGKGHVRLRAHLDARCALSSEKDVFILVVCDVCPAQ